MVKTDGDMRRRLLTEHSGRLLRSWAITPAARVANEKKVDFILTILQSRLEVRAVSLVMMLSKEASGWGRERQLPHHERAGRAPYISSPPQEQELGAHPKLSGDGEGEGETSSSASALARQFAQAV